MKLKSFISQGWTLHPIEVEVLLVRGLPELKFIGLPDQAIKESALRIKTAIKQSGFSWPEADQIIVNLKPNHLKKSSRGLELAVAAGILWETGQLPPPNDLAKWVLYGELNLDGHIQQPDDLIWIPDIGSSVLVTGKQMPLSPQPWIDSRWGELEKLRDLLEPQWRNQFTPPDCRRPETPNIFIHPRQAQLALVAAIGRHSALLAGPAGSGKSMMCELIHKMGSNPSNEMQKELWRRRHHPGESQDSSFFWRPFIRPHHSITTQGLIGGGNPPRAGELTRAHHGTLILDELLEFKTSAVEALREPLETNKIRLARANGYQTYPCEFQFLSTTNLCPCGDFVPKVPTRCRYSLTKCRSYSQKLTGPLLDRFQIISFSHLWKGERSESTLCLLEKCEEIRLKIPDRPTPNAQLPETFFRVEEWPLLERKMMEQLHGSHRRYLSTLRVAQTFADIKGKQKIECDDIEEAIKLTVTPFVELQRWD